MLSARSLHKLLKEKMSLRVGVVAFIPDATAGGAQTLLESLVQALETMESNHVFIWLDEVRNIEKAKTDLRGDAFTLGRLRRKISATWLGERLARRVWKVRGSDGQSGWQVQIDEWIRRQQIDIIWFLTPPSVGASASAPYITTVWDLEHRSRPYFPEVSVTGWSWEARDRMYGLVLPRASFILTGTQVGKNEIVHYYGVNPDNVIVVPFPVPAFVAKDYCQPIPDIRIKYGIRGDFLIYPAQFWPHKNHVNLLIALARLKSEKGMAIEMVFTGSDKGNANHVLQKVKELGLQGQVHFLGLVPAEDLRALYSNALALTFASFFGPDNLPPLEAFALGCPVAASRVSGAQEQLGDAALLFDPADPDDIASTIFTIWQDKQLRARMVHKGAELARMRTPQAYVARVCNILDKFAAIRRCWGHDYQHT
jgi:glycosyltransferase involved in cell wall biosynthesis